MNQEVFKVLYLVRFGELTTKATKTRRRFMRILVHNLKDALNSYGIDFELKIEWSRIFIKSKNEKIKDVLKRIFGIHSFSPVVEHQFSSLEEIVSYGHHYFKEKVRGKEFAVRARRSGNHPFTSLDIERKLGSQLISYGKVNLNNPEVTAYVEVRGKKVYFFIDVIEGAGGLPIGSEGRVVSLISGGFDSAVASWSMLKRGVILEYVFCNLGGCVHEAGVLKVVKLLSDNWSYGSRPQIHIVDFREIVKEMQEKTPVEYWNVILKRFMYRIGDRIGRDIGAEGIVTGEAVGQVSSQTLRNLRVAEAVTDFPVWRPLLSFDKNEIIQKSREIGTHDISATVKEYCAIIPEHPVTKASLKKIEEAEKNIDFSKLEKVLEERKVIDLRTFSPEELELSSIQVDTIPDGAILLDIRDEEEYGRWHPGGALHIPFIDILNNPNMLEKGKTYILYCNYGLKSVEVARLLREEGIEAYSFKGGVEALKKYLISIDKLVQSP